MENQIDFWELLQSLIAKWEKENSDIVCNEDYEKAILYSIEEVYRMAKSNEI